MSVNLGKNLYKLVPRLFRMNNMTTATMSYNVLHEMNDNRFVIHLEKGDAVLEYSMENSDVINMYHTGVPTAYRGHGIAKHVVQKALDYAVEKSLTIKPTCSYVAKYIADHPNTSYNIHS